MPPGGGARAYDMSASDTEHIGQYWSQYALRPAGQPRGAEGWGRVGGERERGGGEIAETVASRKMGAGQDLQVRKGKEKY